MSTPRATLGDYLADDDPLTVLWSDLVDIVYHASPRQAHLERLSDAARVLYLVGNFDGECANGGISQFFSNSAGEFAHETLAALDRIGAAISMRLLEQAITLFPDATCPQDRQRRCELLFAFEAREPEFLEKLTDEYYRRVLAIGSTTQENLIDLRLAFMAANQASSIVIGK